MSFNDCAVLHFSINLFPYYVNLILYNLLKKYVWHQCWGVTTSLTAFFSNLPAAQQFWNYYIIFRVTSYFFSDKKCAKMLHRYFCQIVLSQFFQLALISSSIYKIITGLINVAFHHGFKLCCITYDVMQIINRLQNRITATKVASTAL